MIDSMVNISVDEFVSVLSDRDRQAGRQAEPAEMKRGSIRVIVH